MLATAIGILSKKPCTWRLSRGSLPFTTLIDRVLLKGFKAIEGEILFDRKIAVCDDLALLFDTFTGLRNKGPIRVFGCFEHPAQRLM